MKNIDLLPAYVPKPGSSVIIPYIPIFRLAYRRKYAFSLEINVVQNYS